MKIAYVNADLHVGDGTAFVGTLVTENGYISDIYPGELRVGEQISETVDLKGKTVIPGLVDVHTHGRAGFDFDLATVEEMKRMARSYVESGVTTLMPTLASEPFEFLCEAADRITSISGKTESIEGMLPCFAGLHLEGRYLNVEKRGAHAPEYLAPLSAEELTRLVQHFPRCFHVSCAAELDESGEFVEAVIRHGGTVGLAHTTASYKEAMRALSRGVTSFTHTYNAMPALHHREGGAVAAAFTSDAYAELIVDGIHVAPEMVKLAYRCKGSDRLVLVTDSMQATGCADGDYSIAGMRCIVTNGIAMTEDGHLAGSTLTLFDGLCNLMRFAGITLDEALPTATRNPAAMVGIGDSVGLLKKSYCADFLILNRDYLESKTPIEQVVLMGRAV